MDRVLEKILTQDNLALLIGSGISINAPSNILSGGDFTKKLIDKISPNKQINAALIDLCNPENPNRDNVGNYLRFEQIMQILIDHVDDNLHVLDFLEQCRVPNKNHYLLSLLLKKGHKILTTNFDCLIEHACIKLNIAHNAIINKSDFRSNLKYPIYKLHGSFSKYENAIWRDTSSSIQATIETVGKGDNVSLEQYKQNVLNRILKQQDLIILGYSGYDDFDICPALATIHSDRRIVWINHAKTFKRFEWNDLEHHVKDRNGIPLVAREGLLFNMGKQNIRSKDNIYLYDIMTEYVFEALREMNCFILPNIEGINTFNTNEYFNNWELNYIPEKSHKYFVCGIIFHRMGKLKQAEESYFESINMNRNSEGKHALAATYNQLSDIQRLKGDYKKALEMLNQAMNIFREIEDAAGVLNTGINLGNIHFLMGEHGFASRYCDSVMKDINMIKKEYGISFPNEEALCYNLQGNISQVQQNFRNSEKMYKKALKLDKKKGDKDRIVKSIHNLGIISQQNENIFKAKERFNWAINLNQKLGMPKGEANSLGQLAEIQYKAGKYKKAKEMFIQVIELFKNMNDKAGMSIAYNHLGRTLHKLNELSEAKLMFTKSMVIAKEISDKNGFIIASIDLAQILFENDENFKETERILLDALAIAYEIANIIEIAACTIKLSYVSIQTDKVEEAIKYSTIAFVFYQHINSQSQEAGKAEELVDSIKPYADANIWDYYFQNANEDLNKLQSRS